MQAQLKLLIILLIFSSSTFAKKRICGNVLQTYLMRVCTFAYEKTPCFNSRFPTSKGIRSSSGRTFSGIANRCCEEGCNVLDIRATCCFKLSCLKRCYPNSGYDRKGKTEENDFLII
ncbi:unnamed protein product [Dracunculus medinensis]|uniref:IlGF domain-containing protein n=1 Tax=Dracunculus medinensis TaxID=318479 RepID=A0A0N4UJ72_DRAME|nr:unnamed protein product [Dracunculus medinensis]